MADFARGTARTPDGGAKECSLAVIGEFGGFDIILEIVPEMMITGHCVQLTAFFVEADPEPAGCQNTSSTFMPSAAPMRAKVKTGSPPSL